MWAQGRVNGPGRGMARPVHCGVRCCSQNKQLSGRRGVENQHAPARELAHRTHANLTLDHVTAVEAAVWSSTTLDGLFGNRH